MLLMEGIGRNAPLVKELAPGCDLTVNDSSPKMIEAGIALDNFQRSQALCCRAQDVPWRKYKAFGLVFLWWGLCYLTAHEGRRLLLDAVAALSEDGAIILAEPVGQSERFECVLGNAVTRPLAFYRGLFHDIGLRVEYERLHEPYAAEDRVFSE